MDSLSASYLTIPNSLAERVDFVASFCASGGGSIKGEPATLVVCSSDNKRQHSVEKFLTEHRISFKSAPSLDKALPSGVFLAKFGCSHAFVVRRDGFKVVFFPDNLLVPTGLGHGRGNRNRNNLAIALNDLRIGLPVVHIEHGVGIFEGSGTKVINGQTYEMLKIRYSNGIIYVPVDSIYAISPHNNTTEPENVRLDSIGGTSWSRLAKSAKENISLIAHQLIEVASKRAVIKAEKYLAEERIGLLEKMASSFNHLETPDQLGAISDIYADLESGRPMYRIVCGDVGFGKTEVAMRAMFAVVCGRFIGLNYAQVAMLCPTVVLAKQQFSSIRSRLGPFGVNVVLLSGGMSTADRRKVLEQIASGWADIIIGTSSILSKTIQYSKLGMVVCDEEHIFGVEQKEAIMQSHSGVHYLALSATPIPRTLYKAMSGLQDMSVILTPPHERIGTKTDIIPFGKQALKAIIQDEQKSGGQTLVITPKIAYIPELRHIIESAFGKRISIVVMHGEMSPIELQKASNMVSNKLCDVVIATTIVASGIDFSYSNTVIIHKPQLFGLSQLHQIRGRVGRRDKQGNCYLLVDEQDMRKEKQMSRLYYLRSFSDFGAGFQIASLDLETRGGGNLISKEQSGKIEEISVGLYYELLNKAVEELKAENGKAVRNLGNRTAGGSHFSATNDGEQIALSTSIVPEISIDRPIYIPEKYITSLQVRLQIYRRIANLATTDDLTNFYRDLADRFGDVKVTIQNLDEVVGLREFCLFRNIKRLSKNGGSLSIWVADKSIVNFPRLLALATNKNSGVKILPNDIINIRLSGGNLPHVNNGLGGDSLKDDIFSQIKSSLSLLSGSVFSPDALGK